MRKIFYTIVLFICSAALIVACSAKKGSEEKYKIQTFLSFAASSDDLAIQNIKGEVEKFATDSSNKNIFDIVGFLSARKDIKKAITSNPIFQEVVGTGEKICSDRLRTISFAIKIKGFETHFLESTSDEFVCSNKNKNQCILTYNDSDKKATLSLFNPSIGMAGACTENSCLSSKGLKDHTIGYTSSSRDKSYIVISNGEKLPFSVFGSPINDYSLDYYDNGEPKSYLLHTGDGSSYIIAFDKNGQIKKGIKLASSTNNGENHTEQISDKDILELLSVRAEMDKHFQTLKFFKETDENLSKLYQDSLKCVRS